jgi:hypothetical protein
LRGNEMVETDECSNPLLFPMKSRILIITVALATMSLGAHAADDSDIQKIVFEEQRIEGKIRRPQLVLIKAEQRPTFQPMVMQSFGRSTNIVDGVSQQLIEKSPYQKAFRFAGKKIANYSP